MHTRFSNPGQRLRAALTAAALTCVPAPFAIAGNVGIPIPGGSFADLAAAADLAQSSLRGVDVFLSSGTLFATGAVKAAPGANTARAGFGGLSALNIDPAAFGITAFKAKAESLNFGEFREFLAKFLLEHQGGANGPGFALGSGELARYGISDPTRALGENITLRYSLDLHGTIMFPVGRMDVFSLGFQHGVGPAGRGAPISENFAVWQGGFNSAFVLGLFDDPGIVTTVMDDGPIRTRTIDGTINWDVNVPNGSEFDQLIVATLNLSGPPGTTTASVLLDFGNTISLGFAPGPGFESASITLIGAAVPLPATLPVLLVGAIFALRRRRALPAV